MKQPDLFLEDTESSLRGAQGEARSAVVQGVGVMVAVSAGGEAVGARCFKGRASLTGQGSGGRENEASGDAGFSPWRAGRWRGLSLRLGGWGLEEERGKERR